MILGKSWGSVGHNSPGAGQENLGGAECSWLALALTILRTPELFLISFVVKHCLGLGRLSNGDF